MTLLETCIAAQKQAEEELLHAENRSKSLALEGDALELWSRLENGEPVFIDYEKEQLQEFVFRQDSIAVQALLLKSNEGKEAFISEFICRLGSINGKACLIKTHEEPVCNAALVDVLNKKYAININNSRPFFNLINLYRDDNAKIGNIPSLSIERKARISFPSMRRYLSRRMNHPEDSEPLYRASENKSRLKPKYNISDCPIYPFALAYETLDDQRCVYVKTENEIFKSSFLSNLITSYLRKGKSILIAAKDEKERDETIEYLNKRGAGGLLSNRIISDPLYDISKEAESICSGKGYVFTPEESQILAEMERDVSEYLKIAKAAEGMGIIENGEEALTALNKLSYYRSLRKVSFSLNIEGYGPDDFKKDKLFFEFLKTIPSVTSCSLRKHPLHSYKAHGASKQVYQAFQEIFKKTKKDFEVFIEKLRLAQVDEWGEDCGTFNQYQQARKLINSILRYDGFPLVYFKISENPQAMALALRLNADKEDTDRLFEELCEFVSDINTLSTVPLKKYLEDLSSNKRLVRFKAKSSIRKILRDKRDYQSFVSCLKEYMDSTSDLNEDLEQAEKVFGLNPYSENGPARILRTLEFVDEYRKIIKSHPELDREANIFIRRIFTDTQFREDLRDKMRDADLASDIVAADRKSIADFFSDNILGDDLPFDEIENRINLKLAVSFEDYQDYMSFLSRVAQSTKPIRQGLEYYDVQPFSLSRYENDYWYSLYKSLTNQRYENGLPDPYKALRSLRKAVPYLEKSETVKAFNKMKERAQNIWWNSREAHLIRKTKRLSPHVLPSKLLSRYWETALAITPLQVLAPDDLPLVDNSVFDLVLIVYPETFSDRILSLFLSKGCNAAAVSHILDKRLSGWSVASCDLETLYRGPLVYESLSASFLDLFVYGFDENGFELQTKEESLSPMPLSYIGKDEKRRCAIPYALINGRQLETVVIGTNSLLMAMGLSPTVFFPSVALVINPKSQIEMTDKKAEEFDNEKPAEAGDD